MSELVSNCDPRGLGYVYYEFIQTYCERVAQRDPNTEKIQTYGELLERCVGAAMGMDKYGLKPGDFISICSLNHFDVCVPYVASLFCGVITASVDPTMAASEIVYLLNQTKPKMIFVEEEFVYLIEKVAEKLETKPMIVVFGGSEKHLSFSKFVELRDDKYRPRQPSSLNETALVVFSSGTTGKPKGICHTHKSMLSTIDDIIPSGQITVAWFTSPYWLTFYVQTQRWIKAGTIKLIFRSFDKDNPWEIFKFKIDYLTTGTTKALSFLVHEKPDGVNLDNIRHYWYSGNSISVEQILALRKQLSNVRLANGYGQSELFGSMFKFAFDKEYTDLVKRFPNCVGTPRDDVLWKIVDVDTEEVLGPNQLGELRVKANFQCKGYHNCDSSETFDSEGYLKTGDLAYYNEDMGFFIVNRIKESFKYMHHHIIPTEVEHVLLTHPSIGKTVVLGIPHEMDENRIMAVVELKKKSDDVSEEQIIKYVEERVLDKNRLRAGVKIVDKIPLTVTEKNNRVKLKKMILQNTI